MVQVERTPGTAAEVTEQLVEAASFLVAAGHQGTVSAATTAISAPRENETGVHARHLGPLPGDGVKKGAVFFKRGRCFF